MTRAELIKWDTDDGLVRFRGCDYMLVKSAGDEDGAIATREAYEAFAPSFAHAYADEGIMRFHVRLGDLSDLEVVP